MLEVRVSLSAFRRIAVRMCVCDTVGMCIVGCICTVHMHVECVHGYVCVISSVFGPLKGSCGAEGEEKITGADIICFCHVGLASGLTHTLWPSQTRTPSGCTCTHASTRRTHTRTDTHTYAVVEG